MDVISLQTEIAKLGLDLGAVMGLVVERTLGLVEAEGAAIELAEGDHMVYRAAAGTAAPQIGLRLDRATSMSGLCVATGEMLKCDDSEIDPRVDREACRRVGLRSMIVMPLLHNGQTVGALKAMSGQVARFQESEMAVLGLVSEVIAAAMYHATQFDPDGLFYRATHDSLTGLANRALFMDRMRTTLSQNSRAQRSAGILMIDMDGLKGINDNFGHRAGDAVITEFAGRLAGAARQTDTVARLGGDEFGIILSPVEHPEGIDHAVGRFAQAMEPAFQFEGRFYQLQASIGTAHFPEDGNELTRLIDTADERMYAMKRSRKASRSA